MNKFIFLLTLVFGFSAQADEATLKNLFEGQYRVISKACFGTANLYNSKAAIDIQDNRFTVSINGAEPFQIHMLEGTETQVVDGVSYTKSGIACGNCFLYGETAKYEGRKPAPGKKVYLSQLEYGLHWEEGRIIFTRTERVNARHSKKAYCDLAPLR